MRTRRVVPFLAAALCSVALTPASAWADEALRITGADVTVVCPLTIGGNFEAKTTAVSGNLSPTGGGSVKGAVAIDLMKIETGISLRDRHLRNNYLEVQKGADFAVAKVENLKVEKLPGKTTFHGTLWLHGQQREINGTADVQQDGKSYRVEASFPIQISSFQIPKPTYLGVGVSDEITVRVSLTAVPGGSGVGATTTGQ